MLFWGFITKTVNVWVREMWNLVVGGIFEYVMYTLLLPPTVILILLHTVYSLVMYYWIMVAGKGGSRSPQWLRSRTQIFKLIKCNCDKGIIILFVYNFFWVFLWFWILATFTPGLLQFIIINLFEKLAFPTDIYFKLIYSWQNPFVYNSMLIINNY